jgi:hypothetical protein
MHGGMQRHAGPGNSSCILKGINKDPQPWDEGGSVEPITLYILARQGAATTFRRISPNKTGSGKVRDCKKWLWLGMCKLGRYTATADMACDMRDPT